MNKWTGVGSPPESLRNGEIRPRQGTDSCLASR